jgi:DNA invertase Pin-like site-specific DNA recombinase
MSRKIEKQGWVPDKIQSHHLERIAIVYVRQSTMQQVLDHQESTRLQYGLTGRAEAWGWSQERIITIDEDLGKSGSSAEGRTGFQRLMSEVSLNHVGLVLGIEMSRLARCSKDWHQLLEVCALFGTLIADLDGIYDPSQYNDRLLLGLKGTMSEAELHMIKQRMLQGKRNKAERGELGFHVPIGYVRRPSGEIRLDPDEQVQQVVRLIFRKFEELGTLNAVLRYLVQHQIQVGVRVLRGENKGDLEWHCPNRQTLRNILKNPSYAGAYAYGRSHIDPRKKQPGKPHTGQVVSAPEDWLVLIQDHHPAYISWQQYQDHLAQLKSNQARADEMGAVRSGQALLTGLLVCGKCNCSMSVQYRREGHPRYICGREMAEYGGKLCQHLASQCLDQYISEQVLQALSPSALEVTIAAATHIEQDRCELDKLWQQRLERTAFEAERAGRHYRLVEPENRLVARQLAQEWESKMKVHQSLKEDYDRFCHEQPKQLSDEEKQQIREIANNLPILWNESTTTSVQRKEIIRQVIQTIKVNVIDQTEHVEVSIQWWGGTLTDAQLIRPVAKWTQLSNYPKLCQRIEQLFKQGYCPDEITQTLNREGFYPPKRRQTLNVEEIRTLIHRLGLLSPIPQSVQSPLAENEWWLADLSQTLEMPSITLYNWIRRGWVRARQLSERPHHWIIWADDAELERLRNHRQTPAGEVLHQRWNGTVPSIAQGPILPKDLQ